MHFDRPAVIAVAHAHALQRLCIDRPKGAEVRVAGAPQPVHQLTSEPVSKTLLGCQRAFLRFTHNARANHELARAVYNGIDDPGQFLGMVGIVPVEKHEHVGLRAGRDAGQAGCAIARLGFVDDPCAVGAGHVCRAVVRAVVGDDDVIDPCGDVVDHAADGVLFVECWNDDCDMLVLSHAGLRSRGLTYDAMASRAPHSSKPHTGNHMSQTIPCEKVS